METSKSEKKNHWVLLAVVFLLTIVALAVLNRKQHETNSERWKNRETKWNNRDNEDQSNSESTQNFIEKGYSHRDIKQLKDWGFEASDVPDLKAEKRRGVVNCLSVGDKKGYCSELVIIKKESRHVNNSNLSGMKIIQSRQFADTRNYNDAVIRFAIAKIIEKGYNWKYDVYVLQANENATISGSSAGSGVYMAFLSACYSDCAIPKNLAITGVLDTEKKEISNEVESIPQKYQLSTDHCVQCGKYSFNYHFIYDRIAHRLEKEYHKNATNPDSQWVYCTQEHCVEWWKENVYNCSGCNKQRFGSCSCCGKHHSWKRESNDDEVFCSKDCIDKRYPKTCQEGKIVAIGGIKEKVAAAVEKGCNIIIIPKENSSDYYEEVCLSVQEKVKSLYKAESYKDLEKFLTTKF